MNLPELVDLLPLAIIVVFVVGAAVTDVLRREVPNVVTIPLLISGFGYHAAVGQWFVPELGLWGGLAISLAGAALGFGLLILPYLMGGMSAYDVKLLTAIGAWLGFAKTLNLFVIGTLFTVMCGLLILLRRESLTDLWFRLKILFLKMRNFGASFRTPRPAGQAAAVRSGPQPSAWHLLSLRMRGFAHFFLAEGRLENPPQPALEGAGAGTADRAYLGDGRISFVFMIASGLVGVLLVVLFSQYR